MIATSLICLALSLHIEARGESKEGKIAVASVIMNRVQASNSTVCAEITKPGQFPWAKNKIKRAHHDYVISKEAHPKGLQWEQSLQLAANVLDGNYNHLPKIKYFHNVREFPKWKLKFAYKIGNHKFYYG
jgi:spore germination cell wall hydrolase CwlJ-like protein